MDPALYHSLGKLDDDAWWWFVGRRAIIREVLERYLRPKRALRILDAGCGSGGNLPMLASFGLVTGLEPNDIALAHARKRAGGSIRVLRGSIPNEVPHESFDLIGLFDVLEHLEHPVAALRVFRERLTREGRLVITVPAFPFLWSKHDELNHHFRRYTVRSLTGELAAAGFEIEFHTHYNIPLFAPIAMVRLFRKLIPGDETGSDFASSEGVLNRALAAVFQAERHLVSRLQFPFGVSLLALARPKA